jgi:prophage regulatory protein
MSASKRILREPEVLQRYGIAHATLWRQVKAGKFPQPVRIAERACGWIEGELDEFTAGLKRVGPAEAP